MNILWITDVLPNAQVGGAPTIYFHLMKRISEHHRITLLSLIRSEEEEPMAEALKVFCHRVETVLRPSPAGLRIAMRTVFSGQPPINRGFWSYEMDERIPQLCIEEGIDVVHIEHAHMAAYVRSIPRCSGSPRTVLVLHNIGPVLFKRMCRVENPWRWKVELWLDWMLSTHWERRIANRFDAIVTLSPEDKGMLPSEELKARCQVVRHGIDTERLRPLPGLSETGELLMVGDMSYVPNRDAVEFFCREIFPGILSKYPEARLTVIGKNAPEGIEKALPVTLTGFVESVVPYYERAAMLIVPLRSGSGVRGKILESMALGRPVVSTSLGCEGLDVSHGENILIADGPSAFTEAVVSLLRDPVRRLALAKGGRQYVESHHAWSRSAACLLQVYESIGRTDKANDHCRVESRRTLIARVAWRRRWIIGCFLFLVVGMVSTFIVIAKTSLWLPKILLAVLFGLVGGVVLAYLAEYLEEAQKQKIPFRDVPK